MAFTGCSLTPPDRRAPETASRTEFAALDASCFRSAWRRIGARFLMSDPDHGSRHSASLTVHLRFARILGHGQPFTRRPRDRLGVERRVLLPKAQTPPGIELHTGACADFHVGSPAR